jgi:uncharacterized protein YaiE (UPF0345 family)
LIKFAEKAMFKTNEYFDGNVKSMSFNTLEGPATLGLMAPGEYEFGTRSTEYMTVLSGEMTVLLPDQQAWATFRPYETFVVPANTRFKLRISADVAYKCLYQ